MRSADPISARYDADAAAYERLWAPILRPFGRALLEALPLAGARRILDLGTGTGTLLPLIRAMAPEAVIVAVDGSRGMLMRAPAVFPRMVGDACRLGLATESMDVAILAFMLFHLADPPRALAEARRVLRPEGAIGTITWDGPPTFAAQLAWNQELDAHGAAPIDDDPTDHRPVDSEAKVAGFLAGAGFANIRTWSVPFAHRFGRDELTDKLTSMGTSAHRLATLAAKEREEFLQSARRRLESIPEEDFVDRATLIHATATAVRPIRFPPTADG